MYRPWYRHPKTIQEKRQNQDGYCRPKRNPKRLVDFWDDRPVRHQKSWKNSRRTQYRTGKRGRRHTIFIDDMYITLWSIEDFFVEHSIPYNIEKVYAENSTFRNLIGYNIIWWSDKNIGINYIVNKSIY